MSLIDNPYTFDDVDFSSSLFTEFPTMSDLLQDPPEDGYATTVDEDEFHAPKTEPANFGEFSFPDLKADPFSLPGLLPEQQQPKLALGPALSLSPDALAAPPASNSTGDAGDASSAALLQVLTQAALHQSLGQSPQMTHAPSTATTPSLPASPPSSSISPRALSPTGTPTVFSTPAKLIKQESGSVSPAAPSEASAPTTMKRKRRAREASELLDMDAPVQKRTYLAPSATSRKELPQSNAEQLDPDTQALLAKRHKNTMAARQSRRRKAEELETLQGDNARLAALNAELERRLQDAETELASFRLRYGKA